jgi:hypothetical protein
LAQLTLTTEKHMSPAKKLDHSQAVQEVGVVRRSKDGAFAVATDGGEVTCRRATSCLVNPEADDTVLVATTKAGRAWILAVLEREEGSKTELVADGDLDVRLRRGKFTVAANEGVGIVSGEEVNVVSGRFNLNAVDGSVALQRLTYVGRFVQSEVEKIRSLAGTFDSILDRFSQRVKRSFRTVEELDQVKARQVSYRAEKTMSLQGGNTLMTAEKLVKVDGEQIHLG